MARMDVPVCSIGCAINNFILASETKEEGKIVKKKKLSVKTIREKTKYFVAIKNDQNGMERQKKTSRKIQTKERKEYVRI